MKRNLFWIGNKSFLTHPLHQAGISRWKNLFNITRSFHFFDSLCRAVKWILQINFHCFSSQSCFKASNVEANYKTHWEENKNSEIIWNILNFRLFNWIWFCAFRLLNNSTLNDLSSTLNGRSGARILIWAFKWSCTLC